MDVSLHRSAESSLRLFHQGVFNVFAGRLRAPCCGPRQHATPSASRRFLHTPRRRPRALNRRNANGAFGVLTRLTEPSLIHLKAMLRTTVVQIFDPRCGRCQDLIMMAQLRPYRGRRGGRTGWPTPPPLSGAGLDILGSPRSVGIDSARHLPGHAGVAPSVLLLWLHRQRRFCRHVFDLC